MRRLVWFTLGFSGAAGVLLGALWSAAVPVCAAAVLAAASVTLLSLRFRPLVVGKHILWGFALGAGLCLFLQRTDYLPLLELDGTEQPLTLVCQTDSAQGRYSQSVDAELTYGGKAYTVRAYLGAGQTARAGETLEGTFRLKVTLPGGSKEGYYPGIGVFALASPRGEIAVLPAEKSLSTLPSRLAAGAKNSIKTCFPEDAAGFAASLLLGSTEELSYEAETALRIGGIRHIVAVSGLHVAILFGMIWLLCGKRPWPAFLLGLPVLGLFGAMAGSTPSVGRACIMAAMLLLSRLTRRTYDPLTALAMAVLCLLTANPFVITAAGFQLSVLSVLGILLFQRPLAEGLRGGLGWLPKRLGQPLSDSLSVTLSAMALSTPVSAYYFGTVSLIGIVTNLLTLWMLPVVFFGILGVCFLAPVLPGVGSLLGSLTAWPIRLILWIAGGLSKLPMAALYTCSQWYVYWLVLVYILLGLWLLLRRKHGWALLTTGAAALIAAAILTGYGPRTDDVRLTVLDVGEGQCLLLQSGGENAVIDCGGDSDTRAADAAWQWLRSQNFYKLDLLIQTHFDQDHFGGTAGLLSQLPAEQILLPGETDRISGQVLTEDSAYPFGKGTLRLFPYTGGNSSNENSMAILFEAENCVILITGDLTAAGEKRLLREEKLPKVDILVVGHHGSKYSTCQELLDGIQPELAVISVGKSNTYGHPAQEVLERLAMAGCTVRRTDTEGTIVIRREYCGEETGIRR